MLQHIISKSGCEERYHISHTLALKQHKEKCERLNLLLHIIYQGILEILLLILKQFLTGYRLVITS